MTVRKRVRKDEGARPGNTCRECGRTLRLNERRKCRLCATRTTWKDSDGIFYGEGFSAPCDD